MAQETDGGGLTVTVGVCWQVPVLQQLEFLSSLELHKTLKGYSALETRFIRSARHPRTCRTCQEV